MSEWNSAQYLKFKNQRTKPAIDLAMRVAGLCDPKTIVDIGCGPGNSTAVLRTFFPGAEVFGIDNSPDMIKKAKEENPELSFRLCDASALEGKYDLLFSNACLQWIPHHEVLIPALMDRLNDGGVLAVQIPMNGEEPLFRLIKEVAADPKWGIDETGLQYNQVLSPHEYFDILSDCASFFDIWEVQYYHHLADHNALVEWVKGTRLRPYLAFLGEERGADFVNEITEKAKATYSVRKNGGVILGFRRFFFTAKK